MTQLLLDIPAQSLVNLGLKELRSRLLDLICQGAYQEGDFVLTSGQRSSYYINGKLVTLHPQGALMVGRLLLEQINPAAAGVAGLTLGADPMVTAVSLVGMYRDRPLFPLIIRKQAKGHGTKAYIEGVPLPPGSTVTVLEDVVTTGQSALQAVERLQGAGYQVDQILALVDRQQGGAQLYQDQGLAFTALFTINDIQAHWAMLKSQ
ncbi:orotate phosphoribosyltransferase [Nodosilinea sp. P-1105]|uniref:orotate phosphoribosyltransferase n=1 Tax=Nodosilinea sp. P-1105 TaxID=2546229 RepID=UPI00146B4744|nr:orotate phosphoribosyltransferase [Nodosilinea sp. P-1105]NMF84297.1 orotate phosphoribosyltransferase [Nodosilinea sp. P-1105]